MGVANRDAVLTFKNLCSRTQQCYQRYLTNTNTNLTFVKDSGTLLRASVPSLMPTYSGKKSPLQSTSPRAWDF
jgi:hypothetical protein